MIRPSGIWNCFIPVALLFHTFFNFQGNLNVICENKLRTNANTNISSTYRPFKVVAYQVYSAN